MDAGGWIHAVWYLTKVLFAGIVFVPLLVLVGDRGILPVIVAVGYALVAIALLFDQVDALVQARIEQAEQGPDAPQDTDGMGGETSTDGGSDT